MKRKKIISNRMMLATKLVIFSLLIVTAIWTTNLLFYSVSSQSNNSQLKEGDMSITEKEQSLIRILEDKNLRENSPEKVIEAIKQIGKLKSAGVTSAIDAIPALVDLLDYRKAEEKSNNSDAISGFRPVAPEGIYPAIEPLFLIGKPALPFLAKVIKENELDSTKSENALLTTSYIFREDLSKGIEFLEQTKINSTNSEGRNRLDKAIEKIRIKWLRSKN